MNIMVLIVNYPPVINSSSRLYSELVDSLREMGHDLTVITAHPSSEDIVDKGHEYYKNPSSLHESTKGLNLLRVSPLSFLSKIPGGKALRFFLSCCLFAIRGVFAKRPDVVLVYSPPLYMGISGYIISILKRSKYIFNLQDIHPKVLFDSGVIKNPLIKSIFSKMEEICYKKAHSLIVYSEGNRNHILQKGTPGQIYIIPNWADTNAAISCDKTYSFRNEEIIGNKFVVSYAGTMQEAQGLHVVVEAAEALKEYKDIIFLLAGEGTSKTVLESLINKKKITNVLLRPAMPKLQYNQFIYDSDVCLISLSPAIPLQTVPGKLADLMSCSKPLIAAVNQKGDAANIIKQARCGFCVDPEDVKEFSQAVLKMYGDAKLRKEMGENGRLFVEQYFSRDVCTKQYEAVLINTLKSNPAGRPV